ncbi:hypothetical protein KY290_036519 [Solanum tuberosum]|uniref:Uncharacterized protein n=1 Tax=Solanum tuberosum TaxID=4113 RepID=A0ABQ7TSW6_SOLTU|nr:hypothetical protein KY289_036014 [Solanum tuberosum]KAH0641044.1 hypothetical protein KY285_037630 [Solanum tuberosum]KAH0737814.1 hypothetical protein KY290_036519 [Solanum tuberosum]
MDITLPRIESVWIGFDSNDDINGEGRCPKEHALKNIEKQVPKNPKKQVRKNPSKQVPQNPNEQVSINSNEQVPLNQNEQVRQPPKQHHKADNGKATNQKKVTSVSTTEDKVVACTSSPTPHGYPNMCVAISPPYGYPIISVAAPPPHGNPRICATTSHPHGYPIMRVIAPTPHGNPIICGANYNLLVEGGEDDGQNDAIGGSDGCQEKPIEPISTSPPHQVTSKLARPKHKIQLKNIATSPEGKAKPNAQKRKVAQNKKAELNDEKTASF